MYESINSCLRPLCSMGGFNVITAEGIGSKAAGYHPVQTALASHNGSQCGFCSVGYGGVLDAKGCFPTCLQPRALNHAGAYLHHGDAPLHSMAGGPCKPTRC